MGGMLRRELGRTQWNGSLRLGGSAEARPGACSKPTYHADVDDLFAGVRLASEAFAWRGELIKLAHLLGEACQSTAEGPQEPAEETFPA
jgi:hypothetical protein